MITNPRRPFAESILYLGTGAILTFAFVGLLALGGALRLGWHDRMTVSLARAVPVDVARGDGYHVTYRSWDDLAAAQQSYQKRISAVQGVAPQPIRTIQQGSLDSSVRLAQTRQLAAHYGIRISTPEVQQQLQRFVEQTEDPSKFVQLLNDFYGWDIPTFERVIVEPFLLRQKVDAAIAADRSLGEDPAAKADRLHTAVLAEGADFGEIAKRESEDPGTAPDGGRTLITTSTFSDPAISTAVFALKDGAVSDVLETERGRIIVMAEKSLKDETSGSTVLQARIILVRLRNVDTVVADSLAKQAPKILLYPFSWNAQLGCVVVPGSLCAGM
jgi:hypothetical protein